MKPILCLDFDGVCHSYISGWQGVDVIPDEPVTGLWDFLEAASREFEIHIFSSRSHQKGFYVSGVCAMINWFGQKAPYVGPVTAFVCTPSESHITWHGSGVSLVFPSVKPPSFVTLDDRALTFTGVWPSVEELKAFKPWNKQ